MARSRGADRSAATGRVAAMARQAGISLACDDREIPWWLAEKQPLPDLLPILDEPGPYSDELAAFPLHELILRHGSLTDRPEAAHLAGRLEAAGHDLAWLPLRRMWLEDAAFPLVGYPSLRMEPVPFSTGAEPPGIGRVEVEWPDALAAGRILLDYQVSDWDLAEARLYLLERPIRPAEFDASLLRGLGAECLHGTGDVRARQVNARDLWTVLFQKATAGGPCSPIFGSGYCRARAWDSLTALCGLPPSTDLDTVEAVAGECTWLLFEADTDWYMHIDPSLDVGVAVLHPDGESVALLAATNSD